MKKIINGFVLLLTALFTLQGNVFADVLNPDELIKRVASDGKNAVVKMKKPNINSFDEAMAFELTLDGYFRRALENEMYSTWIDCEDGSVTDCTIHFIDGGENDTPIKVTITYDEPKENKAVDALVALYKNSLKDFSHDSTVDDYYVLEDLSLINYYQTNSKSELWENGAAGRALKYSTLNSITKGSNFDYYLDPRAGAQSEFFMYEYAWGPMGIYYNDYLYDIVEQGIYFKRVIYIPEDTEDTDEAYIAAAQKRINDYLGNKEVEVSYGGLISDLESIWGESPESDDFPIESNGKYYNIKAKDRSYKFYIIKGSKEQLIAPTYEGLDIETLIEILSKDSSIPLDTALKVKEILNEKLKELIGTDNYKSFDISLYSSAMNANIEKLDNGKFEVRIPIPESMKGKTLIVYYFDQNGTKHPYEVLPKDGYAVFETDHFSTYTLAEKVGEDSPDTYDGISSSFVIGIISL